MDRKSVIDAITKGSPNRLRHKYFEKNHPDILRVILDYTVSMPDLDFKWRVWHWVNDQPGYMLCSCGNRVSPHVVVADGYRRFCSAKCAANDPVLRDSARATLLDKYGVDHYSKTADYADKVKKTTKERYGVDNYSKTKEFRKKLRETSLTKWGVESYTQTEDYVRKTKESNVKRWGVDSYLKTEEGQLRIKAAVKSRLGVETILGDEAFRAANFQIASDPLYVKYIGDSVSLFTCDLGQVHEFEISTDNYYGRLRSGNHLCTICNPVSSSRSFKEVEFRRFIMDAYSGEVVANHRDGLELDIFLPALSLGFEFNGVYWHSDRLRDKDYHARKTDHFAEKGIRVVHVWEDDWTLRGDIVRSQVRNMLGLTEIKVHARTCEVRVVPKRHCLDFLETNHIQGSAASEVKLGLYHSGTLVSVMTFDRWEGRKKMGTGEYNLNRFCTLTDHSVPGAASKLLTHFIRAHRPKRIISYADRDWSSGRLYDTLGFTKVGTTKPDYKYVVGGRRTHKSRFRKSRLKNKGTERTQTDLMGLPRTWDTGKMKYEMLRSVII